MRPSATSATGGPRTPAKSAACEDYELRLFAFGLDARDPSVASALPETTCVAEEPGFFFQRMQPKSKASVLLIDSLTKAGRLFTNCC